MNNADRSWPDCAHIAAQLKMRCDVSGADYCLFWKSGPAGMEVGGSYVTPESQAEGKTGTFAEASLNVVLRLAGSSGVSKTATSQSQEPIFIEDVQSCAFFVRREMAAQHGIKSICFTRGSSGVIEFGSRSANWKSAARSAAVPEAALAKVFQSGASYAIFWKVLDAEYQAVTDYILPEWAEALRAERGNDETYVSRSLEIALSVSTTSLVASAINLDQHVEERSLYHLCMYILHPNAY